MIVKQSQCQKQTTIWKNQSKGVREHELMNRMKEARSILQNNFSYIKVMNSAVLKELRKETVKEQLLDID